MNNAIAIETKTLPATIKAALEEVEYGARDIMARVSDKVSGYSGGNQGQRGFIIIVNIASGEKVTHWGSWGGSNPFTTQQIDVDTNSYPMKPGFVVISGTIGHPRTMATLHLHPENTVKLLPAKSEVSDRDRSILNAFGGLTSAGRKNQWESYPESKPTEGELDSLVSRGLLKRSKNGATQITTAGKNAR